MEHEWVFLTNSRPIPLEAPCTMETPPSHLDAALQKNAFLNDLIKIGGDTASFIIIRSHPPLFVFQGKRILLFILRSFLLFFAPSILR